MHSGIYHPTYHSKVIDLIKGWKLLTRGKTGRKCSSSGKYVNRKTEHLSGHVHQLVLSSDTSQTSDLVQSAAPISDLCSCVKRYWEIPAGCTTWDKGTRYPQSHISKRLGHIGYSSRKTKRKKGTSKYIFHISVPLVHTSPILEIFRNVSNSIVLPKLKGCIWIFTVQRSYNNILKTEQGEIITSTGSNVLQWEAPPWWNSPYLFRKSQERSVMCFFGGALNSKRNAPSSVLISFRYSAGRP